MDEAAAACAHDQIAKAFLQHCSPDIGCYRTPGGCSGFRDLRRERGEQRRAACRVARSARRRAAGRQGHNAFSRPRRDCLPPVVGGSRGRRRSRGSGPRRSLGYRSGVFPGMDWRADSLARDARCLGRSAGKGPDPGCVRREHHLRFVAQELSRVTDPPHSEFNRGTGPDDHKQPALLKIPLLTPTRRRRYFRQGR